MISIIVPVYNVQNYIEKCVDSIRDQTFHDWELLLIDNGSGDNSLSLCEKFSQEDERIRVFHQESNTGVSAARNLGIQEAKGEYLTFVDADDWVRPDFLEKLITLQSKNGILNSEFAPERNLPTYPVEASENQNADMVICGYEKRFPADRYKGFEVGILGGDEDLKESIADRDEGHKGRITDSAVIKAESDVIRYTREDCLKEYILAGNTHCWGVLYTKKLLEGLTFPEDLSIGEDLLFLIDAVLKADRIIVTDYPGYQYFINTQGAMEKPFTPSYMDQIICWQRAMEKITPLYPKLTIKLESLLLVAVLLVVGKLARLKKEEQKKYDKEQKYCHSLVKQYSNKKEVYALLPPGYPLKVRLYRYFPQVYMPAYGRWKG